MLEYKSDNTLIAAPVTAVFARLSNLEGLRDLINQLPEDKIPADKREQLKSLEITADTITLAGGPTGKITLRVVERKAPELIALRPDGIPMDLQLQIRLAPAGFEQTEAVVAVVADIPQMLRPMVKGPLQKLVDQFAQMLATIPFN